MFDVNVALRIQLLLLFVVVDVDVLVLLYFTVPAGPGDDSQCESRFTEYTENMRRKCIVVGALIMERLKKMKSLWCALCGCEMTPLMLAYLLLGQFFPVVSL